MTTSDVNTLVPCDATAGAACWIEPGTRDVYPVAYGAYRRKREAQEKRPPRHRQLGPDIDHLVWRRCLTSVSDVDIVLAIRPGTPPRIQRMVSEVLARIRRGRSASQAIRDVARRFSLRHGRALAFIAANVMLERHVH